MRQQLDLRHEAENLLVFEGNFARRKVPVTFPRPLTVWSTKGLLVEEYENALPLETFLKNGGGPFDDQVATIGLDAFLVGVPIPPSISYSRCMRRTCFSSTTSSTLIFILATS
jgi:predicted unusual protein kinase regulating ubiquinone biosynthesis (AarF/ABC1/UbiB family)